MSSQDQQDFDQSDALNEGRRIYVGNLLYSLTPTDIESVLRDSGFPHYSKIHISIDPVSGRNPGYCFVEFPSRADAEDALRNLPGVVVQNRTLKVGPCNPKSTPRSARRPWADRGQLAFNRWGDWTPEKRAAAEPEEQGPYGALQHHAVETSTLQPDGRHVRRLYIGGLGKMYDQTHNQAEMKEILAGFDYVAIGKRITPRQGGHHYCFVDFSTADEAERARQALNGAPWKGTRLLVQLAKGLNASNNHPLDQPTSSSSTFDGNGESSSYGNLGSRRPPYGDDRGGRDSWGSSAGRDRDQQQQGQWGSGRGGRGNGARPPREDREEREARQRAILAADNWRAAAPAPAQ
ncbi:hypothetical protein VTJ04DRAFT_1586 [Mycothermus thermophilus]|uniref:uncharacterized protein n=1 Tax=Humicola insolens TaxID=85995 RepID=UPI0037431661